MATKKEATPLTRRLRPIRNIDDVCLHMNRIYREGRFGEIETQDMGRFANILNLMAGIFKTKDLEERIIRLEEILEEQNNRLKSVA